MPEPETDDVVPWEFRVAHALPIPASAMGGLVAAILLAVFLVLSWVCGFPLSAPGEVLSESARDSILGALLLGYSFAALRLGGAGIEDDFDRAGVADRAKVGEFPRNIVRNSRYAGTLGLVLGFLVITSLSKMWGYATAPWTQLHEMSFYLWSLMLLFWIVGRAALFTVQGSRFAAEVTTEEVEIDLLDLRPLSAFGRTGLRFALLWIVGVTIAAPMLLGPRLELTGLLGALGVVGVIAIVALTIPVLGVRNQIRAAKQAELVQIAAAIAGDDVAIGKTRIAQRRQEPSLADLIAYRGLVESVREWPYDASTLSRFALYLLIPLASWVAAAFVERVVDSLLR